MREIQLTQGKMALVDDEDFEKVSQFKWFAIYNKKTNAFSAGKKIRGLDNKKRIIYMHQFIMGSHLKGTNYSVNHIDSNLLNNQKINLRVCNSSQRSANKTINSKNNTSGYKGVSFDKSRSKYIAVIQIKSKKLTIGRFHSLSEAALAYNKKAIEVFGEFASINNIMGGRQDRISA